MTLPETPGAPVTRPGRPGRGRRPAVVTAAVVVAGLVTGALGLLGAALVVLVVLLAAARAARRRSRGPLATGLLLLAGAPAGFAVYTALELAGLGRPSASTLHAGAVTAYAIGTASLLAAVAVLARAWARASGQRVGVAVTGVAAVGGVLGWNAFWWAWGRAFDLADAGRSTAAYDPVLRAAGLTVLACAAVGVAAGVVTLVRSRQQLRAR